MKKLCIMTAMIGLTACSTTVKPTASEDVVRAIASLNACYEISLRYSDEIAKIKHDTDYEQIGIPADLIPAYREQQRIVRTVPWNCDLWFNNPDYVDHITVLLK